MVDAPQACVDLEVFASRSPRPSNTQTSPRPSSPRCLRRVLVLRLYHLTSKGRPRFFSHKTPPGAPPCPSPRAITPCLSPPAQRLHVDLTDRSRIYAASELFVRVRLTRTPNNLPRCLRDRLDTLLFPLQPTCLAAAPSLASNRIDPSLIVGFITTAPGRPSESIRRWSTLACTSRATPPSLRLSRAVTGSKRIDAVVSRHFCADEVDVVRADGCRAWVSRNAPAEGRLAGQAPRRALQVVAVDSIVPTSPNTRTCRSPEARAKRLWIRPAAEGISCDASFEDRRRS